MELTARPAITLRLFADCSVVRGPFIQGSRLVNGERETFVRHTPRNYGPPASGFPFRR